MLKSNLHKNLLKLISVLLLMGMLFSVSGCDTITSLFSVSAENISLNTDEYIFTHIGEEYKLEAFISPEDASNKILKWRSGNEEIVYVDQSGMMTAISEGSVVIAVETTDGSMLFATCNVKVDPYIAVDQLILSTETFSFDSFGQTVQLNAEVIPNTATNNQIIWSVTDSSVITVDSNGLVTSVGNGMAFVECLIQDKENYITRTCEFVVNCYIPVEDVNFSITKFEFKEITDTLNLLPVFTPFDTTERDLVWTNSDNKIATVDTVSGVVTPLANGKTTIKAAFPNGKKLAVCEITVNMTIPLTGIELKEKTYTLTKKDQIYKISVDYLPSNASDKKLTFESDNNTVASVDANGNVKAVSNGSAKINILSNDGKFTQTFEIIVEIPAKQDIAVNGITLKTFDANFSKIGETFQIVPIITPSDATNQSVTYTSQNPDVVSVSASGVVTAVGTGGAIIKVTTVDQNRSDNFYCLVNLEKEEIIEENVDTIQNNNQSTSAENITVSNDSELRGVWVATVDLIDFPSKTGLSADELRKELATIMDNCVKWGLNAVFLQVHPKADALYKSSYFPSSQYITNLQGAPLPCDVLAVAIEEAHKKGIQLHAWYNPYRVSMYSAKIEDLHETNPARLHPEWVVVHDNRLYFNPGIPEVQQLLLNDIGEMVRNYDIDGIHFDDYFYPWENAKNFKDEAQYALYGNGLSLADWRRQNNDRLIQNTYTLIKSIKSNVIFGVSPGGVWAMKSNNSLGTDIKSSSETYYQVYADTRKWVKEGWLDYIAPQIYWQIEHSTAPFKPIVDWWNECVNGTNVKLYIGIGAYRAKDTSAYMKPDEIINELNYMASKPNCSGPIFFSYNSIKNNLGSIESTLISRYANVSSNSNNSVNNNADTNIPNTVNTNIIPSSNKVEFFSTKLTADSGDKNAFILGSSDPNYPLYADGKEVTTRSERGFFSYYAPLVSKADTVVVFTHKGESYSYSINRRVDPIISDYLDSFKFVSGSFSPQNDYASTSGTTLTVSCRAPAGANVYVTIGSQVIQLTTTVKKPTNGRYLAAKYEAVFTLPYVAGNEVIGTPVFVAEMDGQRITHTGSNVVEIINNPSLYVVEIINDKCDIKPNLNVNPETYIMGTLGMKDTVVSKSAGNARLGSGYYISVNDIKKASDPQLQLATIGSVSLVNSGKYTNVIIPTDTNVSHLVWMFEDRTEITLFNLMSTNFQTPNLGDNPLFSSVKVTVVDLTTVKIVLTYKAKNHIFGYFANFDNGRLIVNYKNPVKVSTGDKPLLGIFISIDPGHSDSTGALGPTGGKSNYEAALNMALATRVKSKLEAMGATVYMTHNGLGGIKLEQIIKNYRAINPDLNVSIHFNSVAQTADPWKPIGTDTFWCYQNSRLLASTMLDTYTSVLNRTKRATHHDYYLVSRLCEFPSILFETAFICNPVEFEWYIEPTNQDAAATAIVAGIYKFCTVQSDVS